MRPGILAFPLLLALISPTRAQQQPQSINDPLELHGIVLNSANHQPIPNALVQLDNGEQSQFTIADGTFSFTNLPAGQHSVLPRKPGFLNDQESVHTPPWHNFSIILPATVSLTVTLDPEAILYGEVKNELGEPVEGVTVRAQRWQINNGHRELMNVGTDTATDDEGKFRIAELSSGDYQLAFIPSSRNGWVNYSKLTASHHVEQGYGMQFYPGVPDSASATTLRLRAGDQLHIAQILSRQRLFEVSGVIRGVPSGDGLSLELTSDSGDPVQKSVRLDLKSGQFQILGVPAGSYILRASSQIPKPGTQEVTNLTASLPIFVHSDFSGAVITLGQTISIPIQLRDEIPPDPNNYPHQVTVQLLSKEFHQMSLATMVPHRRPVGKDGKEVKDQLARIDDIPPGTYSVEAQLHHPGYIAALRCGTLDLLREDLLVAPGSTPAPIEVTIRDDPAQLQVTLIDAAQSPNAGIILYSEDSPRFSFLMQPTGNGQFQLGNLPPGRYAIVALPNASELEFRDPTVMFAHLTHAATITLSPSSNSTARVELQKPQEDQPQ
jgi:hypothetical protein